MNIQQTVGDNTRTIRQARGMTMEDLAARIYKGKSTISKYEKGSIAIDIATLEEIAIALEVHPSQLLMSSAPEQSTPQAQGLVDETYMFSYDGREKRIITSVIERYATEESNSS